MQVHQTDFEMNIDGNTLFVRLSAERMSRFWSSWRLDRHSNAEYEAHMILTGSGQADVEDQHYTLGSGQGILIPPNQHHSSVSLPGEFLRLTIPFFLPENDLARRMRRQFPVSHVFSIAPETERLCRTIINELSTRPPFWQDLFPHLLSALMVCLFRQFLPSSDLSAAQLNRTEQSRTERIDQYLQTNFMCNIQLEDLAKLLHLSRRQTTRVLLENYGMSFRERLLNIRMDRAAWLLRTTDMPVGKLIGAVGYASEAAFYQTFRSYFKITPLQYRKQFTHPEQDQEQEEI